MIKKKKSKIEDEKIEFFGDACDSILYLKALFKIRKEISFWEDKIEMYFKLIDIIHDVEEKEFEKLQEYINAYDKLSDWGKKFILIFFTRFGTYKITKGVTQLDNEEKSMSNKVFDLLSNLKACFQIRKNASGIKEDDLDSYLYFLNLIEQEEHRIWLDIEKEMK